MKGSHVILGAFAVIANLFIGAWIDRRWLRSEPAAYGVPTRGIANTGMAAHPRDAASTRGAFRDLADVRPKGASGKSAHPPPSEARKLPPDFGGLGSAECAERAAELSRALNQPKAGRELQELARHWGKIDPQAALAFVGTLPEGELRTMTRAMALNGWASTDPRAATTYALALGESDGRMAALKGALGEWTRQSPADAAAFAAALPAGQSKTEALSMVAIRWAESDWSAAASWARELPAGVGQAEAVRHVARQSLMAGGDPRDAAGLVAALPVGEARQRLTAEVAETWAGRDLAGAVEWARQLPPGREQTAALGALGDGLPGGRDPGVGPPGCGPPMGGSRPGRRRPLDRGVAPGRLA